MESALCQIIKELREDLQMYISIYDNYKATGRLPPTLSAESEDTNSNSSSPPRVENIRAPYPPRYPPPHAQNSPAFFPLSCVSAPRIEPTDLEFALVEVIMDAAAIGEAAAEEEDPSLSTAQDSTICTGTTGILPTCQGATVVVPESIEDKDTMDQGYDSDSSDEFSWAQWYVTRDYAAEREEQDRNDVAQRASGQPVTHWFSDDESPLRIDSDSGYDTDDIDNDSDDDLAWMDDGGEMIAPY